jgi:hypothetical protein
MQFFNPTSERRNPFLGISILIDRLRRMFAPRPKNSELRSRIRVAFLSA